MFIDEIRWITTQLDRYLPKDAKTCLDIGSDGEEYRTVRQPWISNLLYAYVSRRGIVIRKMDLDPTYRPDYVHDVTVTPTLIPVHDLVLATNLLEHIVWEKFEAAVANIESLVRPEGGILVVSVPHKYPIHYRPIDNGWRPSAQELVKPFYGTVKQTDTIEVHHDNPGNEGKPLPKISVALLQY